MTNRSPNAVRSPALRRLARRLRGVGLSAAWLAGVGTAGAAVSMRTAYPRVPQAAPAEGWPPARPVPEGRLAVAVVLGASGSVITDALGPYEVFARSPGSSCTRCRPAARPRCCRVGWPWCPTTRWTTSTRAWRPNRTWSWSRPWLPRTARRKHRCASGSPAGSTGEHTCWACATAAGCSRPRACLMVAGPPRTGRPSGPGAQPSPGGLGPRPALCPGRHPHHHRRGDLGVFGALRLVEQLAGAGEAQRVGQELAYPGWSLHGPTEIRAALGATRSGVPAGGGLPVVAPNGRRRPGRGGRRAGGRRPVRGLRQLLRGPHRPDRRRGHRHHPTRAAPGRDPHRCDRTGGTG